MSIKWNYKSNGELRPDLADYANSAQIGGTIAAEPSYSGC